MTDPQHATNTHRPMPSGHGSRRCASGALLGSTSLGVAGRGDRCRVLAGSERRHVAGRSRVGVAAFSVATMLGLVGVMGLARPASSATPTAPVDTTAEPLPAPTSASDTAAPQRRRRRPGPGDRRAAWR